MSPEPALTEQMDRLTPFHCPETLHSLLSPIIYAGACSEEGCAWFEVAIRAWLDMWRNLSWKRVTEQKATFRAEQGTNRGKGTTWMLVLTLVTSWEIITAVLPDHGGSAFWHYLPHSLRHTKFADLVPVIAPGPNGRDKSCQETLPMATGAGTVSGYEEATLWCGLPLCSSIR